MDKARNAFMNVVSVKACKMNDGGVVKTLYKCSFVLGDGDVGSIYTQTEVSVGSMLEIGLKTKEGGKLEPFVLGFADKV